MKNSRSDTDKRDNITNTVRIFHAHAERTKRALRNSDRIDHCHCQYRYRFSARLPVSCDLPDTRASRPVRHRDSTNHSPADHHYTTHSTYTTYRTEHQNYRGRRTEREGARVERVLITFVVSRLFGLCVCTKILTRFLHTTTTSPHHDNRKRLVIGR